MPSTSILCRPRTASDTNHTRPRSAFPQRLRGRRFWEGFDRDMVGRITLLPRRVNSREREIVETGRQLRSRQRERVDAVVRRDRNVSPRVERREQGSRVVEPEAVGSPVMRVFPQQRDRRISGQVNRRGMCSDRQDNEKNQFSEHSVMSHVSSRLPT